MKSGTPTRCWGCAAELENPRDPCPHCGFQASASFWDALALDRDIGATAWTWRMAAPDLILLNGRYRVGELIARGGMGVVHRGVDLERDRLVAVKFLSERYLGDGEVVKRFLREAQATASLSHPSIVPVHAFGEVTGRPYFVMDYIQGKTVGELIREQRRLSLAEAVAIAVQVCDGLAHIHAHALVHRDIKPQNILVEPDGRARLLDFGIMRVLGATRSRTVLLAGTPEYMSPEQALDAATVDGRADLYALGVTLFEMLTGSVPYASTSPFKVLLQHQSQPIPSARARVPGLPIRTDELLRKALAKEPSARYARAAELRDALTALLQKDTDPVSRAPRSRRTALAAAVALPVAIGACMVWAWSTAPSADLPAEADVRASPPPPQAQHLTPSRMPHETLGSRATSTPLTSSAPPSPTPERAAPLAVLRQVEPPTVVSARPVSLAPARKKQDSPRARPRARRAGRRAAKAESEPSKPSAATELPKAPPPDVPRPTDTHDLEAAHLRVVESPKPEAALPATAADSDAPAMLHVVALHAGRGTWVRLYLNGDFMRESHVAYRKVPPGAHTIVARREGFREVTRAVTLRPGEARKVVLEMDKAR